MVRSTLFWPPLQAAPKGENRADCNIFWRMCILSEITDILWLIYKLRRQGAGTIKSSEVICFRYNRRLPSEYEIWSRHRWISTRSNKTEIHKYLWLRLRSDDAMYIILKLRSCALIWLQFRHRILRSGWDLDGLQIHDRCHEAWWISSHLRTNIGRSHRHPWTIGSH